MLPKKSKNKIKKIDVLITSVVLGTIISGAFGLKKMYQKPEQGGMKKPSLIRKILEILLGK